MYQIPRGQAVSPSAISNAPTPIDPAKLAGILANIKEANARAGALCLRLTSSMDYVLGSEPQDPSGKAETASQGALFEINDSLSYLFTLLGSLSQQVSRLERVVG